MGQIEYLSEKLSNFNQMKTLAETQVRALTDGDDLDRFFDLLKQRERLRSQIMANDRKIQRLPKNDRVATPDRRVAALQNQIEQAILATLKLDQQIEGLIGRRREKLLAEIKDLRQGHKALKGYGGKAPINPYHIDKRG
jgi:flagellar biosynthesis/type III secretory pathway chaperone